MKTWGIMNGRQDKNEERVLRGQRRQMRESATLYSLYESNRYKKTVAGDGKELQNRP